MFTIEVVYRTGNTFHTSQENECLDIQWVDIEKAKKALQEIIEFMDFHNAMDGWSVSPDEKKMILGLAKKMPWAGDFEYGLSDIMLEMDDGIRVLQDMSFCTGYFENLESARIVLTKQSGLCYDPCSSKNLDFKDLQRKYGAHKNVK